MPLTCRRAGLLSLALLLAGLTVAGCSSFERLDTRGVPKISLADSTRLGEVGMTMERHGRVVLLVPAGASLPLDAAISLPFGRLDPGANNIKFSRDVYLYISAERLMLSPDGDRWASPGDLDAMKELFRFERGEIQIGFGVSEARGAALMLHVRTH